MPVNQENQKKNTPFDQFDSQRTLLEGIRLVALVIWFLYAFFADPFSPIQITAFFIVIVVSLLNTIKLASQTIKNKEGSFYSQFGGLIFLYWLFLYLKIRGLAVFDPYDFFGMSFSSVFQFEKLLLGIALVISSLMFNIIDANLKVKIELENKYQLLLSYTFRAMGMSLLLVVFLTIFTWLPDFPVKVLGLNYIDTVLGIACIFMLTYAITSSSNQTRQFKKTGEMSLGLGVMIFILINYMHGFIELFSVIDFKDAVFLQSYWQDVLVFLFVLGVIINIIFSTESSRNKTRSRRSPRKKSVQKANKTKSIPLSIEGIDSTSQKSRLQRFIAAVRYSTSNISLDRLAKQIKVESIEELEDWLIELNLNNLIINWETSSLIISEALKEEIDNLPTTVNS